MHNNNLLTVPEVAERLGVCTQTVYRMARRRDIDHVRVGKRVMFKPSQVDDYLRARTVPARIAELRLAPNPHRPSRGQLIRLPASAKYDWA